MAYPININDVIEVTFEGRLFAQQVMSVFHYVVTNPVTVPNGAEELAFLMDTLNADDGFLAQWLACCSNQLTNATIKVQKIAPLRFLPVQADGISSTGGVGSASMPSNVAVAITKRAEQAGRHGRGTLHMPGVPIEFVTNGSVNIVGAGVYDSLRAQILLERTPFGGAVTYQPVIFNRALPLTSQPVLNTVLRREARVMRRRTVGLGS